MYSEQMYLELRILEQVGDYAIPTCIISDFYSLYILIRIE